MKKKLVLAEEERDVAIKHFSDIRAAIRQTTEGANAPEVSDMHHSVTEATQEVGYQNESLVELICVDGTIAGCTFDSADEV